jgi:TRAP-type C4-dicarboxylate transport system permease small subunit
MTLRNRDRLFRRLSVGIDMSARLASHVAVAMIFAIAAILCLSVYRRYVISSPMAILNEWSSFLLLIVVALSFAETERTEGHVSVELLTAKLGKKWKRRFEQLSSVVIFVFCTFMVYASLTVGFQQYSEGMRTVIARIPLAWNQYLLALAFMLFALQPLKRTLFSGRLVPSEMSDDY